MTEEGVTSLFARFTQAARTSWRALARPEQIPPDDFAIFVMQAGRAAGKNWAASHYITEQAMTGPLRIALVAQTEHDARFVMVEGKSGILALARPGERPEWEPANSQLTWPSGAIARLYSSDSPDSLRGPEHDLAWCDELAAWRQPDKTWDNLLMTMRGGSRPRVIVTTTPKPMKLLRELISRDGTDGIVVRRFTTYANKTLPASFLAQLVRKYEGTRLARQELLGEMLEDVPGALWSREVLDATRADSEPAQLVRVAVGVDPSGSTSDAAGEAGLIIAALGADGHGYVLADMSGKYSPTEWARKAVGAFHSRHADKVVVEKNYGGDMAAATIAAVDAGVPVKDITSSRGKVLRAEPIAALFDQHRCHLVGSWPELEDQMCSFTSDWNRARDGSPDRIDAMVFALTELLLGERPGGFIETDSLLRPGVEGQLAPVEAPTSGVSEIFAMVSVTEHEPDAIGVVYFAITPASSATLTTATILDWDLLEFLPTAFDTLYTTTAARLSELLELTSARSRHAQLYIEPTGVGEILFEEAQARGLIPHPIDAEELTSRPLSQRAIEFGAHLAGSRVKIARPAFEKAAQFKGVRRNHLLAQFRAFGLTPEQAAVPPLLAAAATGALDSLRADRALDTWRRLACADDPVPPWFKLSGIMTPEQAQARAARQHAAFQQREQILAARRAQGERYVEAQSAREREAGRIRAERIRAAGAEET